MSTCYWTSADLTDVRPDRRPAWNVKLQAPIAWFGRSMHALQQNARYTRWRHELAVTAFDLGLVCGIVLLLVAL